MEKEGFDYPYSMLRLLTCKVDEIIGGQKVHLIECRDIADFKVLLNCAKYVVWIQMIGKKLIMIKNFRVGLTQI
jgi:hypothetical protein